LLSLRRTRRAAGTKPGMVGPFPAKGGGRASSSGAAGAPTPCMPGPAASPRQRALFERGAGMLMAPQWDRRARLGASVGARARRRRRSARGGAPGDCWRRLDCRQARSCASARPPRRACGACCAAGARRGPRARSAGAYTGGRSSQALSSSGAPRAARRPPFAPAQSASRGGWTRAARAARERRVLGSFGRAPAWPGHWRAPLSRARAPFAKVSTQLDAQCPHCPWRRAARAWQGAGRWGRLGRRWWCCCVRWPIDVRAISRKVLDLLENGWTAPRKTRSTFQHLAPVGAWRRWLRTELFAGQQAAPRRAASALLAPSARKRLPRTARRKTAGSSCTARCTTSQSGAYTRGRSVAQPLSQSRRGTRLAVAQPRAQAHGFAPCDWMLAGARTSASARRGALAHACRAA